MPQRCIARSGTQLELRRAILVAQEDRASFEISILHALYSQGYMCSLCLNPRIGDWMVDESTNVQHETEHLPNRVPWLVARTMLVRYSLSSTLQALPPNTQLHSSRKLIGENDSRKVEKRS